MNQILSVEMPKSKHKSYKSSKKADIRTIIIFFCVILILFALIIAVVAVSMLNKGDKEQEPNQTPIIMGTQPVINVEIQSEKTLNIIVTHDKQISSITYNWNDGESIEENNIGETTKEIQVEIPAGTNTLNVNVTDINGVTQSYTNQYAGSQGPSLVLKEENGKIKIIAQSNVQISYISYNWDGGEEKQIQINDVKTEQLIEVPEGEHTLNVVLVDMQGQETTQSQTIKGDNKPTLNITTDSRKTNLYIEVSDDEGLTKMTVENYDTKEVKEYEINDKQYSQAVPLQTGDNKLIITIYNVNGIKNEQRVRVQK